jgi:4-hydroxybenzoate polyprenyltransferase
MRHIPAGILTKSFTTAFIVLASLMFVVAAAMLNPLCLWLSPVALGIVFAYSYTKRFTALSHLILGFTLGIAPSAAWIAIRGSLDPRILWLTAAVAFWTAGFDIIYSCQDYDFDSREALFSIPRRAGIANALWISRFFHLAMLACLAALVASFHLGMVSVAGIAAVALLLVYEHRLVKADDLSRVDAAFFTVNGYVSVLFFFFWSLDIFLSRGGI